MPFETLRLEIVRPGPRHGVLISRLTNYVSLCEGVAGDTLTLPFEHHELRSDIRALRYFAERPADDGQPRTPEAIPNTLRAAAVDRLSRRLAQVLAQMPGFQTRLAEAGGKAGLTHVRLALGGSELSMVPFELAEGPQGWQAAGGKLLLQSRAPVVITRELRDSHLLPLRWNRRPRVLICGASPTGFSEPPVMAHVQAVVEALRPWIDGGTEGGRSMRPQDVVTVLEHASPEAIRDELAAKSYTHVHFICHGCRMPGDDERYGLALVDRRDRHRLVPTDADRLSDVLMGPPSRRHTPTMVVLAACDSANQDTVETPGASLAFSLHHEGIPWVLASQLPLTYGGSATLARVWYAGIFRGDDPRDVLHEMRQELAADAGQRHDWASMVAYGAMPSDFDEQVEAFRIRQIKAHIDSAFRRAARLRESGNGREGCSREFERIDGYLSAWGSQQTDARNDKEHAEFEGICASVAKQKAELSDDDDQRRAYLERARTHYGNAARAQIGNHWVIVQYVSLCRLLGSELLPGWSATAGHSARLDIELDRGKAWAYGSLMELAMLDETGRAEGRDYLAWTDAFCREVAPRGFELFSTLRQFRRYGQPVFVTEANAIGVGDRAAEIVAQLEARKAQAK